MLSGEERHILNMEYTDKRRHGTTTQQKKRSWTPSSTDVKALPISELERTGTNHLRWRQNRNHGLDSVTHSIVKNVNIYIEYNLSTARYSQRSPQTQPTIKYAMNRHNVTTII
jgi:hypothetical protein